MKTGRHQTRRIHVGSVAVGGGAPISVQTMTKTDTRDVDATVAQIREVASIGCDIVRVAVPDEQAAKAFAEIRKQTEIPVVADIHFNHRLAIMALEAGADGLRINPGNIGGIECVKEVVRAARERNIPIRIGVNSGSLEKDVARKHGGSTPEALVESALRHVRMIEEIGYRNMKISVKASDARRTIETYRLLSSKTDYPLHLGVTEAGTLVSGTVRSCVAMGILMAEGIGDTIRVSLSDTPRQEVKVGLELLRSLGLREPGPTVVSCPTCGRTEVDVVNLAQRVEIELERHYWGKKYDDRRKPRVAVMGCMVNGPGEAGEADIAVVGGKGKVALYVGGKYVRTTEESDALTALLAEVEKWQG